MINKHKIFFTEKSGAYMLPVPRNGFTLNDPNSEFSDNFFVEWTYPVEDPFTEDLKRMFGDLSDPNILSSKKSDEGFLNVEGEIFPAVINFISCKNKVLKYQFEFGYESIPVFDKKLSEFDLPIIEPANIYDFIDSNLSKKYPETNVCFPAVFTDKFNDKADDASFTFKGIYNEMYSGGVLRNEITSAGFQNRNILKPYIYLMYILNKGFEEAGFLLKGDILTDPDFLYAALAHETDFFETVEQVGHKLSTRVYKYASGSNNGLYTKKLGKFNCFGTYTMSLVTTKQWLQYLYFTARWQDSVGVWQEHQLTFTEAAGQTLSTPVELIYTLPPFLQNTEVTLIIEAQASVPYSGDYEHNLNGFLNIPGSGGTFYTPLRTIDFKKYLPDVSFRDLLGTIKRWKNYKLIPKGGDMYMNLVSDSLSDVKNISFVDQDDVELEFNKRKNYILKFGAPEAYEYKDYKYSATGLLEEKMNMDELDSEVISIGGYPLPVVADGALENAREISGNLSGIALIRYEGLVGGRNATLPLTNLLIPNIYNSRYKNWIRNRLEAVFFVWTFSTTNPIARELKSHHKLGAFSNIHKVVNIVKKFIGDDMYYLEIRTENRF